MENLFIPPQTTQQRKMRSIPSLAQRGHLGHCPFQASRSASQNYMLNPQS